METRRLRVIILKVYKSKIILDTHLHFFLLGQRAKADDFHLY